MAKTEINGVPIGAFLEGPVDRRNVPDAHDLAAAEKQLEKLEARRREIKQHQVWKHVRSAELRDLDQDINSLTSLAGIAREHVRASSNQTEIHDMLKRHAEERDIEKKRSHEREREKLNEKAAEPALQKEGFDKQSWLEKRRAALQKKKGKSMGMAD